MPRQRSSKSSFGTLSSSTSSVMAIANTPSLKASTRPVFQRLASGVPAVGGCNRFNRVPPPRRPPSARLPPPGGSGRERASGLAHLAQPQLEGGVDRRAGDALAHQVV